MHMFHQKTLINKYKLKFNTKPWIISALQKSISIKNNLLKKFITAKDPLVKEKYHKKYKGHINMLSKILKQSKTNYYNYYFETIWNSIKNTWKRLKSILNIKEILLISENVISSLDSNKSVRSNSIPTKILKWLKNDISSQLSETFNISFSSGVFPSILKTVKVISIHKKDFRLDFSNYCLSSFLSNIKQNLERLIYNIIYKFLSDSNLIYSL